MHKSFKYFLPLFLLQYSIITVPAGSQESVEGDGIYKINFYGSLSTQEGTNYDVEYVTFNRMIKKIIVYDKPLNETSVKIVNDKITQLLVDPAKVEFEIRLNAPMKIEVPQPERSWIYRKSKNGDERIRHKLEEDPRAVQYIEIIVTDKNNKKNSYLVEKKKHIFARLKDEDSTKIEVQLPALKVLDIHGFTEVKEDKKKIAARLNRTNKKIKIVATDTATSQSHEKL